MRHLLAILLAASAAAAACSRPAAEQSPAARAVGASDPLPAGWKMRLDDPAAPTDRVKGTAERDSLTIVTGPAGIYYKPGMKAEKDYTVSATFSQLKPNPQPQPYGLFVAGTDLDKDTARYTALLIRSDGKYQIATWAGGTPTVVVPWTVAAAMAEPKGVKTSNTLTIRALQDGLHFLIADKEVHQMPRASAGADGVAGLRVGQELTIQVDKFDVKKFP